MGCHGGFNLDEATRRSWYNPEAVLAGLHEGMTFVDIGCGDGFFSLLAAKKVGVNGRVYAVDVDASGVEKLQNQADALKLTNIVAAIGRAEDTIFCEGCADIVFYSMDLHDFEDPTKVLENALKMINPTGKVLDLDWKKHEMPFGPPKAIRFSEEQVSQLFRAVGFCVEFAEAGPYHYLATAKPMHTL
jgi:ubiquinone/menaquinone biosynthesis C-methylase UbiE